MNLSFKLNLCYITYQTTISHTYSMPLVPQVLLIFTVCSHSVYLVFYSYLSLLCNCECVRSFIRSSNIKIYSDECTCVQAERATTVTQAKPMHSGNHYDTIRVCVNACVIRIQMRVRTTEHIHKYTYEGETRMKDDLIRMTANGQS